MEKQYSYPKEYDKQEFVFRYTVPGDESSRIGCHFLNTLPRENGCKVFSTYCGFLVLKGEGEYTDWNGREYPLEPGCFVQHLPGKYHIVHRCSDEWLEASMALGIKHYEAALTMGFIDETRPVIDVGWSSRLIDAFFELHTAMKKSEDDGQQVESTRSWLLRSLDILSLVLDLDIEKGETVNRRSDIDKACRRLEEDLVMELDLRKVASDCGMSYSHFCSEFKRVVGVAPGQYRLKARMDYAKTLLLETEMPIKTIAAELGYSDPFVFSKQFKKETGYSPSKYK